MLTSLPQTSKTIFPRERLLDEHLDFLRIRIIPNPLAKVKNLRFYGNTFKERLTSEDTNGVLEPNYLS